MMQLSAASKNENTLRFCEGQKKEEFCEENVAQLTLIMPLSVRAAETEGRIHW